jgi:magnesium transporter
MSHPLFGPVVRQSLLEDDLEGLKTFCETLHPATVAETLAEDFDVDDCWRVLHQVDIRKQAEIFEYFPSDWQIEMVHGAGRQHIADLIEQMSHDDRVDLLRRLPDNVAEGLLRLVDEADRRDIALLYHHEEDTAGSLMTTEYAWLPANITAGEALDKLRLQAPDSETIYYVYVVDDDRRLLGVASLRDVILAPRQAVIRDIMETDIVAVRVNDDREIVAREMARFDLIAIPVVDDKGKLVGIVTHDDVIDVVVEEATEDVHRLGGVFPIEEKYFEAPFFTVWRKRAFWLACLFVAELLTFGAMDYYAERIEHSPKLWMLLSLFIPLCISIGGNSGSQAVTLITRALALGEVSIADWARVLRHELLMGLVLGFTLGVVGFVFVSLMTDGQSLENVSRYRIAFVIAQAVTGICVWGTIVGSMLPLGFKAIGVDPGIASSPSVATFVDVTGIVIYFSIAMMHLL